MGFNKGILLKDSINEFFEFFSKNRENKYAYNFGFSEITEWKESPFGVFTKEGWRVRTLHGIKENQKKSLLQYKDVKSVLQSPSQPSES